MVFSRARGRVRLTALVSVAVLGGGTSRGATAPEPARTTPGATSPAAPTTGSASSGPAAAARITTVPAAGAKNVNPVAPVRVAAQDGKLTEVSLKNDAGKKVAGSLAADGSSWTAAEVLGYDKDYTLTTAASNADGRRVKKVAKFRTLTPDNMTMPYFDTTGGSGMVNKATYGVGMVVNVHWDEAISNKKAAEKTLTVKTSPAVSGAWNWVDDQNVHWRPRHYYKTGTKVTVRAKVFGVDVGHGLYGQADTSTSFTIGEKHVSIADDRTKHVKVYVNNKMVRSMPTSMGRGGSQTIDGHTITYWTQRGTYTVLDKSNPVIMDSRTYGLPLNKGGYKEPINWATRISTDGVYLHELAATIWAQGHTDVSHGCLNLSPDNARWFFNLSRAGDIVIVRHTGGSPLEIWQNGDWSVPWKDWVKGSAA